MKKFLIAALLMTTTSSVFAQRTALIDHTDKWNLFSRFDLTFSGIDEDTAMLGGVKIGGLLNDRIGMGIAGTIIIDEVETESPFLENLDNTDFWYGGFYTEYVFNPDRLVYASIGLTIGGGEVNVQRVAGGEESSTIFALEPGVNVMINVTETFMLGAGLHYRMISGINSSELQDSDMSDFGGTLFMRFTEF